MDNTGAAFPLVEMYCKARITKRELFAAMAMQGLLSNPFDLTFEDAADDAVRQADALLAALDKEVKS